MVLLKVKRKVRLFITEEKSGIWTHQTKIGCSSAIKNIFGQREGSHWLLNEFDRKIFKPLKRIVGKHIPKFNGTNHALRMRE